MNCPKCGSPLVSARRAAFETLRCNQCEGQWIDRVTVAAILDSTGSPFAAAGFESALFSLEGHQSEHPCPSCEETSLFTASVERVEIDVCCGCGGVFFDAGEISAIKHSQRMNAIESGVAAGGEAAGAVLIELAVQGLAAIGTALLG